MSSIPFAENTVEKNTHTAVQPSGSTGRRVESAKRLSAEHQVMGMLGGYYLTQAVYVAAKLGIADVLHTAPQDAEQLACATGTNAAALYRLLRTLASFGVFAEDDAGRFRQTALSELLRS